MEIWLLLIHSVQSLSRGEFPKQKLLRLETNSIFNQFTWGASFKYIVYIANITSKMLKNTFRGLKTINFLESSFWVMAGLV